MIVQQTNPQFAAVQAADVVAGAELLTFLAMCIRCQYDDPNHAIGIELCSNVTSWQRSENEA